MEQRRSGLAPAPSMVSWPVRQRRGGRSGAFDGRGGEPVGAEARWPGSSGFDGVVAGLSETRWPISSAYEGIVAGLTEARSSDEVEQGGARSSEAEPG